MRLPLLFLLLTTLGAGEATAQLRSRLRFEIVRAGRTTPFDLSPAGVARAQRALVAILGGGYQESVTWSVIRDMAGASPALRYEIDHVADLARAPVRLEFHPADGRGQVVPGQVVKVPERARRFGYSVRLTRGQTLDELATRWGVCVKDILDANDGTLEVWPTAEEDDDGGHVVRVGEHWLSQEERAEALSTMVHELAHAVEKGECDPDYYYGPDQHHYGEEVLSPAAAFSEGWGNYQGSHVAASSSRKEAEAPPRDLVVDRRSPKHARRDCETRDRDEPENVAIPEAALRPEHFLANENFVAGVLLRLEALPGGRGAVDLAFLDGNGKSCRHLGDFLASYARARPQDREAVAGVVAGLFATLDRAPPGAEDLAALVGEGRLPGGLAGGDAPRVEGLDPAPAAQASPVGPVIPVTPAVPEPIRVPEPDPAVLGQ